MLSNGMIMLIAGVVLLIVSFCMLFVFIHSLKKQKNAALEMNTEFSTTAILPKNAKQSVVAATPDVETEVDTSTIPMTSDETAMMGTPSGDETELINN